MSDEPPAKKAETKPAADPSIDPTSVKPADPASPSDLTPEEQMERFAKELKESDWGHQPC